MISTKKQLNALSWQNTVCSMSVSQSLKKKFCVSK